MTRPMLAIIALLMVCSLTGCGLLTTEQNQALQTVVLEQLDKAWAEKGAAAVAAKIDELVGAGKITKEQGDELKAAAQHGYEALRKKAVKIFEKELEKSSP